MQKPEKSADTLIKTAKYVIENIISLLGYLSELSKELKHNETYCQCSNRSGYTSESNYNYMWCVCSDCGKIIEETTEEIMPF